MRQRHLYLFIFIVSMSFFVSSCATTSKESLGGDEKNEQEQIDGTRVLSEIQLPNLISSKNKENDEIYAGWDIYIDVFEIQGGIKKIAGKRLIDVIEPDGEFKISLDDEYRDKNKENSGVFIEDIEVRVRHLDNNFSFVFDIKAIKQEDPFEMGSVIYMSQAENREFVFSARTGLSVGLFEILNTQFQIEVNITKSQR